MNVAFPSSGAAGTAGDAPKTGLSVAEAKRRILAQITRPRGEEHVPIEEACGRTLAQPLVAGRTQPPFDVSAMDGYAIRAEDVTGDLAGGEGAAVRLRLIGESAAGHGFDGRLGPEETVRIFTGAPVPEGADTILIQELATREDSWIIPQKAPPRGRYIRPAGQDFTAGDILINAGRRLTPADIGLAAAANYATVPVFERPRIAILATGDELVRPGEALGPSQIVSSNPYAIAALVREAGGLPIDLGIAGDRLEDLARAIEAARQAKAHALVTSGGVSVGDHDLVRKALSDEGMELNFWRIAMRPGRPLIHGRLHDQSGDMAILGLPGNPVAAMVCGLLFLKPLVRALGGEQAVFEEEVSEPAVLASAVGENDGREDFLRAVYRYDGAGLPLVTPFAAQDSALLSVLSHANCLLIRPPHAVPAQAGEPCRIIRIDR